MLNPFVERALRSGRRRVADPPPPAHTSNEDAMFASLREIGEREGRHDRLLASYAKASLDRCPHFQTVPWLDVQTGRAKYRPQADWRR